jgi:asparagine N-glycosylation enzyme membrane subunit Stt3
MKEAPIIPRRKIGVQAHVGKEFSGAFLIVMLLLLTLTLVLPSPRSIYPRVFDHAYTPVTIATGSMSLRPDRTVVDWFYALNWVRNNESVKVVASWWDYGYWTTIIGNKTTLADNGTINMTQIENIAWMFLSNETQAIEILKPYDVTHVLVFITFDTSGKDIGWGEESKWKWMARISERLTGVNDTGYITKEVDPNTQQTVEKWNDRGKSTVIYKMIQLGKQDVNPDYGEALDDASKSQFGQHFRLVYTSFSDPSRPAKEVTRHYGGAFGIVCIFEVRH